MSYSHADEAWKERVVRQLRVLEPEGGFVVWDDRRIAAGSDWLPEIEAALGACRAALLLISEHFLTSRFILCQEVPALLRHREAEGLLLVPVILRDCAWGRVGWLNPIQARPKDGKALAAMTRAKSDKALADLVHELADLLSPLAPAPLHDRDAPTPRIDLSKLPAGAEHFLGRGQELKALDAAWALGSGILIVEVIAPGGTGKTALIKRWLSALGATGWGGAVLVFGWSFYSQGTGDDRQASEDLFLATAIERLKVQIAPSANPADKGQAIADKLGAQRTLLILDGCEPLQYPPGGPLAGELRAPGLKTMLTQLAAAGQPGLRVVTSREWLADLSEWVRTPANPHGPVLRLDLGNLNDQDGAALLHARGANRAGAAAIGADDPELLAASRDVQGHALTLALLGRYLARARGGDIRQRDAIDPAHADRDARGHAARVIAAYEAWFARAGDQGARPLAALRLLGFFDRPASRDLLAALRAAPPIAGLTEPLFEPPAAPTGRGVLGLPRARKPRAQLIQKPISDTDWTLTLRDLANCGLVDLDPAQPDPHSGALDTHPLVREYLAAALAQRCPDAWREGHRRLYERLKASAPHRPDGLDGLQPLYQAIAHGCQAGLWQEVKDEVYENRILRGTWYDGVYSVKKLGAFGADLAAVACLFAEPWSRPAPALKESDRAWLLLEAGSRLRALGRLGEALEPMRTGAEMTAQREDWKNAAVGYGSLSALQLTLGRVGAAVADARRSVEHADRSGDAVQRSNRRATLADALHQRGETAAARAAFAEAETMQAAFQPEYPRLYSLRGFLYCDLLLAAVERAAWRGDAGAGGADGPRRPAADCTAVAERARQALQIAERNAWLLDIALDHLTLARCALYTDRLAGRPPGAAAQDQTARALDGLRAAAYQNMLPLGLLTRAWLRHAQGDPAGARADLAEADRIASRGGMALHLADIALHRARLFHDRAALTQARHLIDTHGYGRRFPELEDAERTAATWAAAHSVPTLPVGMLTATIGIASADPKDAGSGEGNAGRLGTHPRADRESEGVPANDRTDPTPKLPAASTGPGENPMHLDRLPANRLGLLSIAGCDNPDRDLDLILVHGLGGDAYSTWIADRDGSETFWPVWLAADRPRLGIWTLGYAADASGWKTESMALADRGTQVLDQMESEGLGERPLVFVTHSLGGIVAKQVLRHAISFGVPRWRRIADQTRGIAFIATPHSGANLASFAEFASAVFRTNEQVKELASHDARLRELHHWFRGFYTEHDLNCRTWCERREVRPEIPWLGLKLAKGILVVDATSAEPGLPNEVAVPLDEDHISICKPASRDAQLYKGLLRWVDECARPRPAAAITREKRASLPLETSNPHRDHPMANVFLCHRKADATSTERLAKELRSVGHRVWLDEWSIGVGDSIVAEIDKGLSGTQYLVLCYSSAGPPDWTDREWHSTLHRQLSGHPVKILPARLSGGGPPAILADIKYADLVADWDQGVKDLLRAIR